MIEKFPRAGKDWSCNECGRLIRQGEEYQRLSHGAESAANCVACAEIWEEIQARRGERSFFPKPHEWGTLRALLRRSPAYQDLQNEFGN